MRGEPGRYSDRYGDQNRPKEADRSSAYAVNRSEGPSRALMALERPGKTDARPVRRQRPAAAFLAQLAANRLDLAQTRMRRRASLADMQRSYTTADRLGMAAPRGSRARKSL